MVEEFLEALLRQRSLVLACKNKLHKTNQQILSVKAMMTDQASGHGQSDISALLIRLETARDNVRKELSLLLTMHQQGMKIIHLHPDAQCRAVLIERYINGSSWRQVARTMGFKSSEWPQRVKREALNWLEVHTPESLIPEKYRKFR